MYSILLDFLKGIITSCKINVFAKNMYYDPKLFRLVKKIIKYNIMMHLLPIMLVQLVWYLTGFSIESVLTIIAIPTSIFNTLFHLLHYMDLVNIVSTYSSKSKSGLQQLELTSLAVTMSIYQIVIYLTTSLVNLLFYDKFYFISIFINFVILAVYHSFYCYNNLWQYHKIDIAYRIDMHEKLWPYYLGYGTISTIIYLFSSKQYVMGIYNIYLVFGITLPFLLTTKYPKKEIQYPHIKMRIFSYITLCVINL